MYELESPGPILPSQLPRKSSHHVRLFVGELREASEGICVCRLVHSGVPPSFGRLHSHRHLWCMRIAVSLGNTAASKF